MIYFLILLFLIYLVCEFGAGSDSINLRIGRVMIIIIFSVFIFLQSNIIDEFQKKSDEICPEYEKIETPIYKRK